MAKKPPDLIGFIEKYAPVRLTAWQLKDIEGALAHRFSYLVWPSGYGKTMVAALIIAARLVLSPTKLRSFGGAGDEDQALLLQEALDGIFEHPELAPLVTGVRNTVRVKHHPRSVHKTLTTHAATTWGITPTDLTTDELSEATPAMEKMFHALISSLRKRKDSRLVIITSPGLRGSFAHQLLEEVRGDERWFISERQDEEAPWLDVRHGDLYARMLPRHIVEAKHLGIWTDEAGGVLDRAKVDAIETPDAPDAPGQESVGIDLAVSRDWATLAVVRRVELLYHVVGLHAWVPPRGQKIDLTEIEEEVFLLAQRRPCYFDPWQSQLMMQRLQKRGLECHEFTFSQESRRRLFSRVLDLIEAGRLKTRPHPELKRQLLGLNVKKLPSGGWRIDHRPNHKDDLVVAIGLALEGLPDHGALDASMIAGIGHRATGHLRYGWNDERPPQNSPITVVDAFGTIVDVVQRPARDTRWDW